MRAATARSGRQGAASRSASAGDGTYVKPWRRPRALCSARSRRPDIRTPQHHDEVDARRPWSDSRHLRQILTGLVVRVTPEPTQLQLSPCDVIRDDACVARLLPRQSDALKPSHPERKDVRRIHLTDRKSDATVDRLCRGERACDRVEPGSAPLTTRSDRAFPGPGGDGRRSWAENVVSPFQVATME